MGHLSLGAWWGSFFLPQLPTIIGAVVFAGVLGWSPLARGLLRLRKPRSDDAAMREVHGEIAAVRQELAEVQERLDYSERVLTAIRQDAPLSPITRRGLTPV